MERRLSIRGRKSSFVTGCCLCVLLSKAPAFTQEILVPRDTALRFFRGTAEPPPDWTAVDFDDSGWEEGQSGVGYEEGPVSRRLINTTLDDMVGRYVSVYLRIPFEVTALAEIRLAGFGIQYDDGYVAYLNGVEIARAGIAGTPPPRTRLALDHEINREPEWTALSRDALLEGTNVLAVQGHNRSLNSSDFSVIPQVRAFRSLGSLCPSELRCTLRLGDGQRL